jgi:hypothetical protein
LSCSHTKRQNVFDAQARAVRRADKISLVEMAELAFLIAEVLIRATFLAVEVAVVASSNSSSSSSRSLSPSRSREPAERSSARQAQKPFAALRHEHRAQQFLTTNTEAREAIFGDAEEAPVMFHRDVDSLMMDRLLGPYWPHVVQASWFSNHTICQRCNAVFETTNAEDKCTQGAYHTYTPKLHEVVQRQVEQRMGVVCPPLFLPGVKTARRAVDVKPGPAIERDWLYVDDDGDDPRPVEQLVKDASQFMPPQADEESPNSANLRELAVSPDGAVPVDDADHAMQLERQVRLCYR